MQTIASTILFIQEAHKGQKDLGGTAYWMHPLAVKGFVQLSGAPEYAQMAALLHGVLEDTETTPLMLMDMGFPIETLDMVSDLTRRDNSGQKERYSDYIGRIINSGNWWSIRIKLADFEHHFSPSRLDNLAGEKSLIERYIDAAERLYESLANLDRAGKAGPFDPSQAPGGKLLYKYCGPSVSKYIEKPTDPT